MNQLDSNHHKFEENVRMITTKTGCAFKDGITSNENYNDELSGLPPPPTAMS